MIKGPYFFSFQAKNNDQPEFLNESKDDNQTEGKTNKEKDDSKCKQTSSNKVTITESENSTNKYPIFTKNSFFFLLFR